MHPQFDYVNRMDSLVTLTKKIIFVLGVVYSFELSV